MLNREKLSTPRVGAERRGTERRGKTRFCTVKTKQETRFVYRLEEWWVLVLRSDELAEPESLLVIANCTLRFFVNLLVLVYSL